MASIAEAKQASLTPEMRGFKGKDFTLQDQTIKVLSGNGGEKIDVKDEYTTSAGSTEFDVIIEFDQLFAGLAGNRVSEDQMWKEFHTGSAKVLNNHPDSAIRAQSEAHTDNITRIANDGSLLPTNPQAQQAYSKSVQALTHLAKAELGSDAEESTPIVALRAGFPMTEYMGFSTDKMVLVDAKRLNGKDDKTKLALGLRFVGNKEEIMAKLKTANGNFINADPALATGSTQLGILLWMLAEGIKVKNFDAIAVGAAQQGLVMLDNTTRDLHTQGYDFSFNAITAGLHPELTTDEHPYYIKTKYGLFAVGDGGDYSDLVLPPDLRKRWASCITREHITALYKLDPDFDWEHYLQIGVDISLELMVALQQAAFKVNPLEFGKIFAKE